MATVQIELDRPHAKQQEILSAIETHRYVVVKAGRRMGKSLIASQVSITKMLKGEQVGYITPTYLLAKLFYRELISKIPSRLIASSNKTDLEIHLVTGGFIKFFTAENLDNLRSWHFNYLIVDEAAFIPDLKDGWENAMRATLMDKSGGALFVSTPMGLNYFMALYNKGVNGEHGYKSIHATSYDNPHIKVEEIEAAKLELPKIVFEQEYLAQEQANASNPFGLHIDKNMKPNLSGLPTKVYGIDLSFNLNGDWTVIVGLDENGDMSHFDRFQLSTQMTIDKIKALESKVPKYIDATGGGAVYISLLNDDKSIKNVYPFIFTNESKSNIVWEFVKAVEMGNVSYNEITATEMKTFQYKYTAHGKMTFNAQSGFFDDCIAAICMASYHLKRAIKKSKWTLHTA